MGNGESWAVKHNQGRRPVSSVTVENREFQVLVDTGATVNVMDEITFKRLLADKVTSVSYTHLTLPTKRIV